MEGKSYTKKNVAELTGETPRTIHFWSDVELVIPAVDNPVGRGKNRKYSDENIFEFLIVRELIKRGIKLDDIKHIMAFARKGGLEGKSKWKDIPRFQRTYLILYNHTNRNVSGKLIYSKEAKKTNINIDMQDHSTVTIIDLKKLDEKIKRIITQ